MGQDGPLGNPGTLKQQAFLGILDVRAGSSSENILPIDIKDQFRFNSNLNKFYIIVDSQG